MNQHARFEPKTQTKKKKQPLQAVFIFPGSVPKTSETMREQPVAAEESANSCVSVRARILLSPATKNDFSCCFISLLPRLIRDSGGKIGPLRQVASPDLRLTEDIRGVSSPQSLRLIWFNYTEPRNGMHELRIFQIFIIYNKNNRIDRVY